MRNRLMGLIKIAVGIGLVALLFRTVEDPAALWRQVTAANKLLLAGGMLCYASAVAISGLKWGVLLRATGTQVSVPRLLSYQWVAEFFNNFLPAQVGGDVMRGYALASDTHRKADAAASVLIDRFIGLTVFMLAAAVASTAMFLFGRPGGARFSDEAQLFMRFAALGSSGATLLLLLLLTALLSRRLKRLVERVLDRLPLSSRIVPIWQKLAGAFNAYRHSYRALLITALSSAAIVVLTSINIWLISQAVEPGRISLLEVLALNPIIVFALLAVPLSPGGLGVRQASFAGLFLLIGAGYDLGFAVGLLQQFIGYLVSIPGLLLWLRGSRQQQSPGEQPAPQLR